MLQVLSLVRIATGASVAAAETSARIATAAPSTPLAPGPQPVPRDIERRIARAFLSALDSAR
jgi:hypothetical protein